MNIFDRLKSVSGGGINEQRLLFKVLFEGAHMRTIHDGLLNHRLFTFSQQAKDTKDNAGSNGGRNTTKRRKNTTRQFQKFASGTAFLLGLIKTGGAIVVTCKWKKSKVVG